MEVFILRAHAASTLAMSGGIWFVQIVHYPLFALVADQALGRYEKEHVLRTGWVVGPLMVAEGLTPFWLAARLAGLIVAKPVPLRLKLRRRICVFWEGSFWAVTASFPLLIVQRSEPGFGLPPATVQLTLVVNDEAVLAWSVATLVGPL